MQHILMIPSQFFLGEFSVSSICFDNVDMFNGFKICLHMSVFSVVCAFIFALKKDAPFRGYGYMQTTEDLKCSER